MIIPEALDKEAPITCAPNATVSRPWSEGPTPRPTRGGLPLGRGSVLARDIVQLRDPEAHAYPSARYSVQRYVATGLWAERSRALGSGSRSGDRHSGAAADRS